MADDEGRFQADARLIKGDVWPLDDDISMKKIEKWLQLLTGVTVTVGRKRLPAIILYVVDGVRYGFMPGFVKHQKISHPTPSKLPAPPDSLLKDSGKAPEPLRPDVDVDVELDRDVERIRNTSTAAPAPVDPVDELRHFSQDLISAANAGMVANQAIGESLNPIPFGHGASITASERILQAGVDRKFAISVVYEMGETFRPVDRNLQIKSLGYCADRVIERWNSQSAMTAANGVSRPARIPTGRRPHRNAGEENFENAKRAFGDAPT
jgi:hypothetical protein